MGFAIINLRTKFEVSITSGHKDIKSKRENVKTEWSGVVRGQ